jgi:hypothetical protein
LIWYRSLFTNENDLQYHERRREKQLRNTQARSFVV